MNSIKDNNAFKAKEGEEAKYPRLNVLKKDPLTKAILDKLIAETGVNRRWQPRNKGLPLAEGLAARVSDKTTRNISDTNNIFQLLPDTELAMQVLVSSILSPKDMMNIELGFHIDTQVMDGELSGPMIEVVRQYFEKTYKMKSILPKILEDCLFKKGSYPLLVLPESSLDDIINGDSRVSVEALKHELGADKRPLRSIGILGSPKRSTDYWSLESLQGQSKRLAETESQIPNLMGLSKLPGELTVSDNINALKFPAVITKFRQERIADTLGRAGLGVEMLVKIPQGFKGAVSSPNVPHVGTTQVIVGKGNNGLSNGSAPTTPSELRDDELTRKLYKNRYYQSKPYINVKTQSALKNKTVGHPIVIKLPPEAVIPVHVPSNPEEHIGYFVLLDQYGNPLSRVQETDYYRDLSTNISSSDVSSQLLDAGRRAAVGFNSHDKNLTEAETIRIYADIVEQDLLARLKNGVYGESVEIARPLDVYRVMLARALANRGTQILYVPAELVTYIAFDYNQYGVGKSLLEDNKILASIRAMLLFSSTMSAIKNSTGKTSVKIELDPDDPDPASTVEYMVHEYAKNRQAGYPLGASNPLDIIDFLQNAGIDIQVSGNTAYPETKLMVEDHNSSKVDVDSKLEEDIKRKYFMSLGLSPETIDNTANVEFATSIVTSNLLLAKRVMLYQETLLYFVKDFIHKYISNSSLLWNELLELAQKNKAAVKRTVASISKGTELEPELKKEYTDEKVVNLFLDTLEITLPKPNTAELVNQLEAYVTYSDGLEKTIDAYFGTDSFMLTAFDDMGESTNAVRAALISYYKREWLRNNNVMPELMNLVQQDEKGKPLLDLAEIHGNHLKMIGLSIVDLIKQLKKDREARDKALGVTEEPTDTYGSGDDTESGEDEAGDAEEGDDLGGDEDLELPEEDTENTMDEDAPDADAAEDSKPAKEPESTTAAAKKENEESTAKKKVGEEDEDEDEVKNAKSSKDTDTKDAQLS